MKISKEKLKEIIREEVRQFLNEDDYDTLRDKYGKIKRPKTSKRKSLPDRNKLYLTVSDSEGKKLQKKYYGRIRKDNDGWYMTVSDSLKSVPSDIKKNIDTKQTDKRTVRKFK